MKILLDSNPGIFFTILDMHYDWHITYKRNNQNRRSVGEIFFGERFLE